MMYATVMNYYSLFRIVSKTSIHLP